MSLPKNVVLWGCKNTATDFFKRFRNEINVEYAISNDSSETIFSPEQGIDITVQRPAPPQKRNTFIIICVGYYEPVAEQLILLGYKPMDDFMDYELATALLAHQKMALCYGVCHMRTLTDFLNKSDSFSDEYRCFYYPHYLLQNGYQLQKLNYIIKHCELFIYNTAITNEYSAKNHAALNSLNPNASVIRCQVAMFGGYFPQCKRYYNLPNPYAIRVFGYFETVPFYYPDSYLNSCIDTGMKTSEVLKNIKSGTVYEKKFITDYIDKEWKILKFHENESDIKILDFIKQNYKKKRLYRDEAHMENVILKEYAIQVLQLINLADDLSCRDIEVSPLPVSSHFIYPEVASCLELEWDVTDETLDLRTPTGIKKVSPEEFIVYYLEYCSKIKSLKDIGLLPTVNY